MNRRELVPYTIAGLGVLVGTTVACTEAKRAQGMEQSINKVIRGQILTQQIVCSKLYPGEPRTAKVCRDLLQEEYKKS